MNGGNAEMTDGCSVELAADLEAIRELGPWLRVFLEQVERLELYAKLELAVHEVCVNIVQHAYPNSSGTIRLQAYSGAEGITIWIRDRGIQFSPDSVPRPIPGTLQERGWGLSLVEQLVDQVDYTHEKGENQWLLRVQ
ncbi:MAG: ATP-binding protein [Mycobacteriaceae bacterium]